MADLYASYTDLAAHETEGVDYERRTVSVTGSTWAAIAIHGGGIEPGSGEVARAVGAGLMEHYEFAGIKSSNNSTLHVTSTNFDEPICTGIVTARKRCLSFHGYTGTGRAETAIGGLDTTMMSAITTALTNAGFNVLAAPQEINGNDPNNIANKTTTSAGVQLEMSNALRASFFPNNDLTRAMRDSGQRTDTFNAYVAAVRSAYTGQARMSLGSVNNSRWALIPWTSPDLDIKCSMSTDVLSTGGPHYLHLAGRYFDANNNYLARLAFNTDQTVTLTIRKRVGGTETQLAQADNTSYLTHAANRTFWVRFQISGSTLQARVWLDGAPEPAFWHVSTTDTSFATGTSMGIRSILSSLNTNTLPVTATFDNFQQVTPQTFTVTRSVNGVSKAQSQGTDVRLANPTVISL